MFGQESEQVHATTADRLIPVKLIGKIVTNTNTGEISAYTCKTYRHADRIGSFKTTDDAKTAILEWHTRRCEQAVQDAFAAHDAALAEFGKAREDKNLKQAFRKAHAALCDAREDLIKARGAQAAAKVTPPTKQDLRDTWNAPVRRSKRGYRVSRKEQRRG